MYGECYACMVGVWTGPESHDRWCALGRAPKVGAGVRHTIRTGSVHGRTSWECSCGHAGSVGEFGDASLASDEHINYSAGDTRVDSSAALDAPWRKS